MVITLQTPFITEEPLAINNYKRREHRCLEDVALAAHIPLNGCTSGHT